MNLANSIPFGSFQCYLEEVKTYPEIGACRKGRSMSCLPKRVTKIKTQVMWYLLPVSRALHTVYYER